MAWQVRNLGKPVALAERYYADGADEITFLNITGFRDCAPGMACRNEEFVLCPIHIWSSPVSA